MRGGRRRYGVSVLCVAVALSWSHSALSTPKEEPEVGQSQEQEQDQSQEQEQTTVQSSSQATTITSQRPGSSYVGGGSSNATDTRVRAISGGWLTGSAGIRWDVTDRESRTLRIADEMEDRGQISSADRMRCSIRGIWKVVGGTSDACWTELSGSRTKIDRTSHNREYDVAIQDLQRQLELLQEDVERDDEACERRWESCVGK